MLNTERQKYSLFLDNVDTQDMRKSMHKSLPRRATPRHFRMQFSESMDMGEKKGDLLFGLGGAESLKVLDYLDQASLLTLRLVDRKHLSLVQDHLQDQYIQISKSLAHLNQHKVAKVKYDLENLLQIDQHISPEDFDGLDAFLSSQDLSSHQRNILRLLAYLKSNSSVAKLSHQEILMLLTDRGDS